MKSLKFKFQLISISKNFWKKEGKITIAQIQGELNFAYRYVYYYFEKVLLCIIILAILILYLCPKSKISATVLLPILSDRKLKS